jgi:N-acetylmuramic acid 6-phosphate (MurNAc-6-P) etherase
MKAVQDIEVQAETAQDIVIEADPERMTGPTKGAQVGLVLNESLHVRVLKVLQNLMCDVNLCKSVVHVSFFMSAFS